MLTTRRRRPQRGDSRVIVPTRRSILGRIVAIIGQTFCVSTRGAPPSPDESSSNAHSRSMRRPLGPVGQAET